MFQTISPFWTRAVGFHLWLTSLLSCLNNTVPQMGWSVGRVRRGKKRNGEESLDTHQQRSPPSSHLDRTGAFSCCICSSVVAGVSVWEQYWDSQPWSINQVCGRNEGWSWRHAEDSQPSILCTGEQDIVNFLPWLNSRHPGDDSANQQYIVHRCSGKPARLLL